MVGLRTTPTGVGFCQTNIMDVLALLESICNSPQYQDQIVHIHKIEAREAQYADLSQALPFPLRFALEHIGVDGLYTHQAESIERIRSRKNIVIETGTASGKTLCYNLPVLECLLESPSACALYLFPTKALAQDQIRVLVNLAEAHPDLESALRVHTYDGDTPQYQRRRIREEANLLVTNPDMLNIGILPHHSRWSRFFANLRFVVIDEMHAYRGVFGSHVANVMRRLLRICDYYGGRPQFICCSATIANPLELATNLINQDADLIQNDGSPRGERYFVLWNPPYVDRANRSRRSANMEAQMLMAHLILAGCQTITFTRARVTAELIYRYVRDLLREIDPAYAQAVRAYRGGYLPEDRREIERLLFSGKLLGVTATSALELGIDVGGLDACLIVGFPGTIASLWQQAGRAGRGTDPAMIVLIAHDDPIEQYLMRHPEYLFDQSPESAVIAPENFHIRIKHFLCAVHELPMEAADTEFFGRLTPLLLKELCEAGDMTRVGERYYWASEKYPASDVNLRAITNDSYRIQELPGGRLLGSVNAVNGLAMVYPEAIYLHEAETYLVKQLDMEKKVAYVESVSADYYTQPWFSEEISITEKQAGKVWQRVDIQIGRVRVTHRMVGFARIRFYTLENLGTQFLDMPEQELDTVALWLTPPASVVDAVEQQRGLNYDDGLEGIKNVLESILPLRVMAEQQGIRGKVQPADLDEPAIFLYDAHPGGLGYADKGYDLLDEMMLHAFKLISECDCEDGCPACVRPTHTLMTGSTQPDKHAALSILDGILF
ncbi:MAG: DEAD/DEAH box helicase [Candidatus Poribacteria bacterium]|nr:DEAD/DEAH box helicase [Candidatus Poribacteria bacterium]